MIIVERHGLRATWHGCTYPGCGLDVESRKAREEVAHFDQPWVFAIDTWGPDELWRQVEHPDGTIDEVLTYPRPDWAAPWYAEARGRGVARIETGVIQMHMWERVGTADLQPGTVSSGMPGAYCTVTRTDAGTGSVERTDVEGIGKPVGPPGFEPGTNGL